MVEATCGANSTCQFNYLESSLSPSLTGISTNSITSGSVSLTGKLLNQSNPLVVLTNKASGQVTSWDLEAWIK